MCACTHTIRTAFCGRGACVPPPLSLDELLAEFGAASRDVEDLRRRREEAVALLCDRGDVLLRAKNRYDAALEALIAHARSQARAA